MTINPKNAVIIVNNKKVAATMEVFIYGRSVVINPYKALNEVKIVIKKKTIKMFLKNLVGLKNIKLLTINL